SSTICFYSTGGSGVLVPLPDLITLNDNSSTDNYMLNTCESRTIHVTEIDCNISYSVVARYLDESNIQRTDTILPYAKRNHNFEINHSDFPDLPYDGSINLQVHYVENPQNNNERSEILTYTYTDCSPALTSGPT